MVPASLRRCSGAIILAALVSRSAAFDVDAHDAIGQTSASAMEQKAIQQLKRLLDGKDASDVAGWGHQVDDTFPGMERLHFQVHDDAAQPFCGAVEERVSKCEDSICLLPAIKHFYGKILADEGRKMDFPQIDYNKASKGMKFSDADMIKMLINLIGDLHQPMHVGYAGDDMGMKVRVRFDGKEMSLYDFWDKGMSEKVRNDESNFWLGGWTHVGRIREKFDEDQKLWKEEGAFKSIDRWAAESVKFACDFAYVHQGTKQKMAGPDGASGVIDIDDSTYQSFKTEFLQRILIAGERTAIILNDILDNKEAARLSEGAKVITDADKKEGEQKKEWAKERDLRMKFERDHYGTYDSSAIWKNLAISVVTVPLFLYFVNYGLDPRSITTAVNGLLAAGQATGAAPSRSGKRGE